MKIVEDHPLVSLLFTSVTIASGLYWATNTFIIKPLEKENTVLTTQLKDRSANIKASNEYREQEKHLIKAQSDLENLNIKLKEYNILIKENADIKSNNSYINQSLNSCQQKLNYFEEEIVILQRKSNFYKELNNLKSELKVKEENLEKLIDNRHIYNYSDFQIINAENTVKRLQEQIKLLFASTLKN